MRVVPALAVALSCMTGAIAAMRGPVAPGAAAPSVLLVVLDTVRADAVSANGAVHGTTPAFDALANAGIRYTTARANAPWTLPSHATLFSGLLPAEHGVGWRQPAAPDALTLLAERLRDAGYTTLGVSENPWVGPDTNLAQGFVHFAVTTTPGLDTAEEILTGWLDGLDARKPVFVFVNLMDAHWPWPYDGRFLPHDASMEEAAAVSQWPADHFCEARPSAREQKLLRALYLADVAAADAKLGRIHARLRGWTRGPLITIATSDHGEHFGEHGLASHMFSVREPVLRIPLLVHGIPGAPPAVVETPVALADVAPSVLRWAGLDAASDLPGQPLPERSTDGAAERSIIAESDDVTGDADEASPLARLGAAQAQRLRERCGPGDPVWGDMQAVVRGSLKLVRDAHGGLALFDLTSDPQEQHDLARTRPGVASVLATRLPRRSDGARRDAPRPAASLVERLRALGYLADSGNLR